MGKIGERRLSGRFRVGLDVQFWVREGRIRSRRWTGRTYDMSSSGVSLSVRRPLPKGTHLEMIIAWPLKHDDIYPIYLRAVGDVVRIAGKRRIAVRMACCRMIVGRGTSPPESAAFQDDT